LTAKTPAIIDLDLNGVLQHLNFVRQNLNSMVWFAQLLQPLAIASKLEKYATDCLKAINHIYDLQLRKESIHDRSDGKTQPRSVQTGFRSPAQDPQQEGVSEGVGDVPTEVPGRLGAVANSSQHQKEDAASASRKTRKTRVMHRANIGKKG
jgi:hypothetical protein